MTNMIKNLENLDNYKKKKIAKKIFICLTIIGILFVTIPNTLMLFNPWDLSIELNCEYPCSSSRYYEEFKEFDATYPW